jgi:acetolactate synthase-1/2/3 large subunit
MLTLDRPAPNWVAIAAGHGVEAERVDSAPELARALRFAYATKGPRLIEAWM